jgi:PAS domain S-box-containing protein
MLSFKIILGFLLALLVAAVSVLGIISYRTSQLSHQTSIRVQHTHQALDLVEEISSMSKDLQLESNMFFIRKDSASYRRFNEAKDVLPKINELRSLTHENSTHRIDSLELLLGKLIFFSDSFLLATQQIKDVFKSFPDKLAGNRFYREKIRKVISALKRDEELLLLKEEKANMESMAAFERTFFALLMSIGILIVVTFLAIRYNFNKRIRVEQALKNVNELFGTLFYESPIGLVITHQRDEIILDCNRAYEELTMFTKEELKGKTAHELNIVDSESIRNKLLKEVLAHGKVRDVEVWLKPKNCEPIWASVSAQAIQVNNEPCLLNAILDLTDHKRAEDEIRRALEAQTELTRMKSDFVTMASHEFRTPLTTIQSSSFILAKYAATEFQEKVGKQLGRVRSAINNITMILDEFLSLTKIEEGEIEVHPKVLNLKEYLSSVCHNFEDYAKPGQNIIYQHEGPDNIHADQSLLGNIMDNLLSNAIKYSPENSTIYVTSHVNEQIFLTVKDQGIGIPEEDQKHLFERFFRASNAGNVQGTGLGLHILKRYIDFLNGTIQVKSEVGKGSAFKIILENPVLELK